MLLRTAALLALAFAMPFAHAQDAWPSKPVRMVVAYPPGGSTDYAARVLAQRLSAALGQQVTVENRAGAAGMVGATSVVRAEPDGYTIINAASPEVAISRITTKDLPFDSLKDLAPITLVGTVPFMLVTNPGVPANDLKELVAHAKANPGKLNFSSFGNNTSNHLVGELFKVTAGIDIVHVPYKGSGPSITDLIGGVVQLTFDTPTAVLGHVKAGKLKAIAVSMPTRSSNAPQVPTMSEAGMPGFVGGTWFGLLAPGKTPRPIIERLAAETTKILKSPEVAKQFAERDVEAGGGTPAEFTTFIRAEVDKWQSLAAKAGIKPQ